MRRVAFITMAMLSGAAAFGQGLLDCIDPDVLRALLLQGQGERPQTFTAVVPTEIAALRMPAGFVWIGSSERITGRADANTNTSQVTAAWRSSLSPDAARAATASALTASGWEVRPMPGIGMSVFNSAAAPPSQSACRDGKAVNMNAAAMDGVTYVTFGIQRGAINNSICSSPFRAAPALNPGFERYMPRLAMPVDPATGAPARMQGGGSSARAGSASSRTEFSAKDSAGNIARHFAKQIAEQGWASDASWSGAATAGSSWSRKGDAGAVIQGTLSVTAVGERQFVTVFRVLSLQ
ncbi:MAG: hypothetical protein ABI645_13490 [Pseudomonadota bacterium]